MADYITLVTDESIFIELPEGPSLNAKYKNRSFNLSNEYKNWKNAVKMFMATKRLDPIKGPCALTLHWYRKHKKGDIDSKIKCLLDALEGSVYNNDSQVNELHVFRFEDKLNPRFEIWVETR